MYAVSYGMANRLGISLLLGRLVWITLERQVERLFLAEKALKTVLVC